MTFEEFAERYRLKVRRDECGDPVVRGKVWKAQPRTVAHRADRQPYGHHIYEHDLGRLGLCLMFPMTSSPARWTNAKRKLAAVGFEIRQDGVGEGLSLFDPANEQQARLAIKLAGVRARRQMSESQKRAAADRLAKAREQRAA